MKPEVKKSIEKTIAECLYKKLSAYNPESSAMPFHYRLIGEDRMKLFSFIHSLNTSFGASIFEPVAKTLAETKFKTVKLGYSVPGYIYEKTESKITSLMSDITSGVKTTDKTVEISALKGTLNGKKRIITPTKVDLYLEDYDGTKYLFDLKSAKPNIGEFKGFKRTLLEWAGAELTQDPNAEVHTCIAIPYNPYEPEPYGRWTMTGILDEGNEIKVAADFWDFLAGECVYDELLNCFERVGSAARAEVDKKFDRFRAR